MVNDTENFEKRSKALFDDSVESLNGNIRSRLTQARYKALAEVPKTPVQATRRYWLPAAGLATAALLAVLIVMPYTRTERGATEALAMEDMALLLNDDDLEMIEDMEFYAWLDSDPQALPEAPTNDDDANS